MLVDILGAPGRGEEHPLVLPVRMRPVAVIVDQHQHGVHVQGAGKIILVVRGIVGPLEGHVQVPVIVRRGPLQMGVLDLGEGHQVNEYQVRLLDAG